MKMHKFKTRLASWVELSDTMKKYHFELMEPHTIEFLPGAGMLVGESEKLYSIASTPEMNHGMEMVDDVAGELEKIDFGQEVVMKGPVGGKKFEEEGDDLVFVAVGRGIVATKCMISELLKRRLSKRVIKLYWGLVYVEEMFWEEELHEFDREFENFTMDIVLAKAPYPEWKLCSGAVTDCLRTHESEYADKEFCVVGVKDEVAKVAEFLDENGVNESRVVRMEI